MMPDPTEMVLTGGFATALVVFAVSAGIHGWRHRGMAGEVEFLESASVLEFWRVPGRVLVGFYSPRDLAGVAFVFLVYAGLVLSMAGQSGPVVLKAADLWVNIGFQFIMAGVVAALVVRRVSIVDWLGLRWPSWPWVILLAPGTVLFMWAFFHGLEQVGYMKWMESLGVQTLQDSVKLLQDEKKPEILGLMAFTAVIAAPLCEEVVFRGYFYPVMKCFSGSRVAAFCSALVFSCAHGSLSALLPLFVFGLLLVFLYEKTGSLWAPIAAHFCFNGATVAIQLAIRYLNLPVEISP